MPDVDKDANAPLPELSLATARLRESLKVSQEAFARALGVTSTSVSRWERGLPPGDFQVLNGLWRIARDLGLTAETELFDQARNAARLTAYKGSAARLVASTGKLIDPGLLTPEYQAAAQANFDDPNPGCSLPQWRVMIAARLMMMYYPVSVVGLERVLAPALQIVDEVLRGCTDEAEIYYRGLEREILRLAQRRFLEKFKQAGQEEERESQQGESSESPVKSDSEGV
jgi:transcriptional regulator with XRE-family HTH domain